MVFDALTYAGNIDNLAGLDQDPRYVFVKGDICDEATVRALLEQHQIDTIVHFAAESHVDRSILGPDDFIRTNIVGTHALLKAAKALWVDRKTVPAHRFHHVSTDEVYGSLGPKDPPFHEATPYAPNSPYSASKAASDHLVRAYYETFGLQSVSHQLLEQLWSVPVSREIDPAHHRQYLAGQAVAGVRRRAAGARLAACGGSLRGDRAGAGTGKPGEVYNIGGNSETTNIEIVRTLCGLVDESLSKRADLRAAFPASPAVGGKTSGRFDHACARSAGARPALRHQLYEGQAGVGLRAGARSRHWACGQRLTGIWPTRAGGRRCWGGIMRVGWRRITSGERLVG